MRYQVFYNVITRPGWVIADTTRRNSWSNYWIEATFATEAEAQATADIWNAQGDCPPELHMP
jgi:hypothetical protein